MNFNKLGIFILFLSLRCFAEDYRPVNELFWKEILAAETDKNYAKIVSLADEHFKEVKKDSIEGSEARLAAGIGLSRLGLDFGASQLLAEIIKKNLGTQVANKALQEIEEIARRNPIDEEFIIGEVINDNEFENIPASASDFVSYHQGLFNLKKGYKKWADGDFKKIQAESFWDFQLKYFTALGEIARNRTDSALERFAAIASNQRAPEKLRNIANHQLARLVFEKGDYAKAYEIFSQITLSPREKGLLLLERAWSKYYQKDYPKALGLLGALEAPMFDTSRTPEIYILRMVMYNELCYYDAAFEAINDFKRRYGSTLKLIRARGDLSKNPNIVQLALLDKSVQPWVDLLNLIKDEKETFREYSFEGTFFYRDLKAAYDSKYLEVNSFLDWNLRDKLRNAASQIVDWDDQMTFLEYQTRLDSLRLNRAQGDDIVRPEEIPHLSFDRIFWINRGEFWLDELEDLKVFVEPRCTEGVGK